MSLLWRILVAAFLATKLISVRLWLTDRQFPLSPPVLFSESMPGWAHTALLVTTFLSLAVLLYQRSRAWILVLVSAELISCLADMNRWQPWEYFFLFMLLSAAVSANEQPWRKYWTLIMAGMYFYSGLFKVSPGFVHDSWQNLILVKWLGIKNIPSWLLRAGYVPGVVEALAGIGLLSARFSRHAACILIGMHLLIMLVIGPTGLNSNLVVWPWNIVLMALLGGLFVSKQQPTHDKRPAGAFRYLVVLCWWILPLLHLTGKWDTYFSAALYGGGAKQLYILPGNAEMRKDLRPYMVRAQKGIRDTGLVSVYRWGIDEMNIVPYPEKKNFKLIRKKLDEKYPGTNRYYIVGSGFVTTTEELSPH